MALLFHTFCSFVLLLVLLLDATFFFLSVLNFATWYMQYIALLAARVIVCKISSMQRSSQDSHPWIIHEWCFRKCLCLLLNLSTPFLSCTCPTWVCFFYWSSLQVTHWRACGDLGEGRSNEKKNIPPKWDIEPWNLLMGRSIMFLWPLLLL